MRFPLRITQLNRFLLLAAVIASGVGFIPSAQAQDQSRVELRQFDMLGADTGWVLLDQKIFWTSDGGQAWKDVSPTLPSGAVVQDVYFADSEAGWVLFSMPDPAGGARFHLARTADGVTWSTRALPLFTPGEIASYAEKAEMGWFDAQTGWISVKQASGSNFSVGALFVTTDGADTWSRFALPVADTVYFNDPQTGWAVGGPTGDRVFQTDDAGANWQEVSPAKIENAQTTAYVPTTSDGDGLLVTMSVGAVNSLNVYRPDPSGRWSLFAQVTLNAQPGLIGLSILDPQNFTATIPGTDSIVRMADGEPGVLTNQDGQSASIVTLDMISPETGWAKSVESSCATVASLDDSSGTVNCSSTTRLLRTADGGVTWQSVMLPSGALSASHITTFRTDRLTTLNSLSDLGNAQRMVGQGFDKCEIPTLGQLQTWAASSPYKAVNLYIGGSARACDNLALTSNYLNLLSEQGWKFIPTWVGPQAPCTNYFSKMSWDRPTARSQGIAEANLAVDTLAALGLTFPDTTGSVVYYDIEYYGSSDTECRGAVKAFMNGWVSQLHARGNLAGVYASPACDTGLSDFQSIAYVPDVVWIAAWYYNVGSPNNTYDPTASVWDWLGNCMPNTVWADHQRLRQYAGPHNETWGGLTMNIDSNVLDGVVAMSFLPNPPPYLTPTSIPTRPRPVMRSDALTPASVTTQLGVTGGSVPSLSLFDQTGVEDDPAAYLSFQTPSTYYLGYQSFFLPEETQSRLVSTMLLQVNFKGPASQVWTWSIYDWGKNLWVKLGDSIGATPGQWNSLLFRIRSPKRYISPGREIRIQLKSNNANGDAKIDYEALHITYVSVPATPAPVTPVATPKRPGIFSAPTSTLGP
ncbi:MAG: DUF1906 domain-containing protein [Chloroflexi bacterium]|nr:DUF1906 domain-containing protein [Chloroflexota bacterium]